MIKIHLEDFDIRKTAESGQCFRFLPVQDGRYSLVADGRYLEIWEEGAQVCFSCKQEEFDAYWRQYFDLEQDYGYICSLADEEDIYMRDAVKLGSGIRILRQELWEVIVSFILSQQNNIPRIRKCVAALCARYGHLQINGKGETYYVFPTPQALAEAKEEDLKECGLGYRGRYIRETAGMVANGTIVLERLADMSYEEAREELMKLSGVGIKVAECICLFALHHVEAFPIDTHIKTMLREHYPEGFPFEKYEGYAGILQQYAFYYELCR